MNNHLPKVSIVIPVYNGANYLKEAIDSALAQTYKNIEIIVVNDGSSDNGATEKIAKAYSNKIKYYKKENGGVATALNLGIEKMTGEYFSWLSHDDMYEKTKIEEQIKLLYKLEVADNVIVACNARVLFPNGIKKNEYIDKNTFEFADIFLATSAVVGVNGCSLLIPKKSLNESSRFDVNLPVTQDYDLWFRLKDKNRFVLLEKNLVISRRHDEQDSIQKSKLMHEAGDALHYNFLKTIQNERFEEYFNQGKNNITHTYKNYEVYKSRGYTKTASMILRVILGYYYKNDLDVFYDIFNSEVEYNNKHNTKSSGIDRRTVALEYKKLLHSNNDVLPLKAPILVNANQQPKNNAEKFMSRIKDSVGRDGVYLTGEKIIRKAYSKIKKTH